MTISSKAKNIEVVKRTQCVKGKIPNLLAFSIPAWFHPYIVLAEPLEPLVEPLAALLPRYY